MSVSLFQGQARAKALFALRYCLSDLAPTGVYEEMEGLPLIPLADGSHGQFQVQACRDGSCHPEPTNNPVYLNRESVSLPWLQKVGALHKDYTTLRSMGFTEGQCLRALAVRDNVADAAEWLIAGKVDLFLHANPRCLWC